MSTGSQHKMYDYEVTPPNGVWDKIVAELDESELSQKFPSLLYHSEVIPPAHVWQQVANELDESALIRDYAAKLSGIAVTPPVNVWNKIQDSMDVETAVPNKRKIVPWIRYAAAAAMLGFIVWGGIRISGNGKKQEPVASNLNQPVQNSNTVSTSIGFQDNDVAVADMNASLEEARNDAALEASKKTVAKLDAGVRKTKIKNAADFFFVADEPDPTVSTRGLDYYPEENEPLDIANRYIVLMTPNGNIIRISKKLRDLACCVSGEEMDKDCVDQMKKWREKIASPSTHSPGNFLDILSLVSSLQDN